MVKYTITPWRYQSDLLSVRQQFYSTDPESRRYAVDRVMAWKLRGNLPHAVESTALLLDAVLHHSITGNSVFSIRAVYSAAFTRFVTGFCDIGRNKERSLEPSSMLDIAKQLGMPPTFVALRHEATHEELPAIQRLVKATEDALQWLWNVYWSRLGEQESQEAMAADLSQIRAESREVFRTYRSAAREALRSKKSNAPREHVHTAQIICASLVDNSPAKARAVADVLVEDRLLLPSKRDIGTPMDGAYMIWDELLQAIATEARHFAASLIQSLLQALASPSSTDPESDSENEGLALWTLHLLDAEKGRQMGLAQRKEVIGWVCTHPGHWTYYLGDKLLRSGDQEFREDWQDILSASQLVQASSSDVAMVDNHVVDDAAMLHGAHLRLSDGADEELTGSWVRAAMPMKTPIGVF